MTEKMTITCANPFKCRQIISALSIGINLCVTPIRTTLCVQQMIRLNDINQDIPCRASQLFEILIYFLVVIIRVDIINVAMCGKSLQMPFKSTKFRISLFKRTNVVTIFYLAFRRQGHHPTE